MASQQKKALCVLRFEVSSSVITAQLSFVRGLKRRATQEKRIF
jgi:hypothetical protein